MLPVTLAQTAAITSLWKSELRLLLRRSLLNDVYITISCEFVLRHAVAGPELWWQTTLVCGHCNRIEPLRSCLAKWEISQWAARRIK